MATKANTNPEITITKIETGEMTFCILGRTPLIMNRMSQKVWMELLLPKGRRTASVKASTLKHDPIAEFRASPYFMPGKQAPTLLAIMPTAYKRGMGTAALDIPGANRSQIGRLVYVAGELLPVYGIPKVFMAITRSADINKTPDVRTRAILEEWACQVTIQYVKPILREQSIANLLSAAGFVAGVGDWRQEKGSGSYGAYELCSADHPDFVRITQIQGRAAQDEALRSPVAYNDETSEMLAWFDVEVKRRGFEVADDVDGAIEDGLLDQEEARRSRVQAAEDLGLPEGPAWMHEMPPLGNGHDQSAGSAP